MAAATTSTARRPGSASPIPPTTSRRPRPAAGPRQGGGSRPPPANPGWTGLAKWHATEHAVQSALDAIQIHGANGYSNEFPVERYLRNAKAAVIYEGTSQLHTLIQADYALGYREDRPLRCEPWPAQGFERAAAT